MTRADGLSLSGVRVLLVDDHEDTRLMLRTFFEHEGAVVADVDSAERALDGVAAAPPAIVLTDLTLGSVERDGLWLLDQIVASPGLARIPVVAITGHAHRRAELRRRGFDDVMIKPVDLGDLTAVVRDAIAHRRARPRG